MIESVRPTSSELRIEFKPAFNALTGHTPLPWQERLFGKMLSGKIPRVCDLPTGLGKTSVIAIWLIALCQQAVDGRVGLPRRLVYIVNRRTVVDQATDTVKQIRERLLKSDCAEWSEHAETLKSLSSALLELSQGELPLAVSTLRGELADNEEWKTDPARAAIIVGTIDMIGSKLLFSGYGDGRYKRPQHAGLIGQDSLIVHDEAHLTPAFSELLRNVSAIQAQESNLRPVRVMELSATRRDGDTGGDVLRLEAADERNSIVAERFGARKLIRLHSSSKRTQNKDMTDLAYGHEGSQAKVLVYVRLPDDAGKIASDLEKRIKDKSRVALLTGTIRGHERDGLVDNDPVYQQMLDPAARPSETVYLVSTSAGEVGIDIDADQMVCDLVPLDSMIQRLGRVNRRGGHQREARVDVVWIEEQAARPSEFEKAAGNTLEILQRWEEKSGGTLDASPRNVRDMIDGLSCEERDAAFSPKPEMREVTDILLDAWSLTSVNNMPGRPEVRAYLHGDSDDPPETYVAWRNEVNLFSQYEVSDRVARDWFRICPILSHERVTERTNRVVSFLRSLLNECRKREELEDDPYIVLLDNLRNARRKHLSEILNKDVVEYRTVVLPEEIGGLAGSGELDWKSRKPESEIDVAEKNDGGVKRRRVFPDCSMPETWKERGRITLRDASEGLEVEEEEKILILAMRDFDLAIDDHEQARFDMTLAKHTKDIVFNVTDIGDMIKLKPEIADALGLACKWHDKGKGRDRWQRYAKKDKDTWQRNARKGDAYEPPYAKSKDYLNWRVLGGYRHELGSLLDAMCDKDVKAHPERDLILHLIASHHGYARPHFDPRAFDNECYGTRANQDAVNEAMRRFGRLQKRYGRWGLAWLEALMRCADIAASQDPDASEGPDKKEEPSVYDVQMELL